MQLLNLLGAVQNQRLILPVVWCVIDALIAVLMAVLGYKLLTG